MTVNGCVLFIHLWLSFSYLSHSLTHTSRSTHTYTHIHLSPLSPCNGLWVRWRLTLFILLCSFCVQHCIHSTQTNGGLTESTFLRTSATFCISKQWMNDYHLQLTGKVERRGNRAVNISYLLCCHWSLLLNNSHVAVLCLCSIRQGTNGLLCPPHYYISSYISNTQRERVREREEEGGREREKLGRLVLIEQRNIPLWECSHESWSSDKTPCTRKLKSLRAVLRPAWL